MTAVNVEFTNDGILVASFADANILDEAKIQQIGREMMELPGRAAAGRLVLDFKGVTFMSSAMIGKIVLLKKKCDAEDTVLKLSNVSDNIRSLLKMTKLKIDIKKDRQTAIESFDKKKWFGLGG